MSRTLRVSVREEITERRTIEVNIPDDLDVTDEDALNTFLESVWTGESSLKYREVPNSNELAITERGFFDSEVLP